MPYFVQVYSCYPYSSLGAYPVRVFYRRGLCCRFSVIAATYRLQCWLLVKNICSAHPLVLARMHHRANLFGLWVLFHSEVACQQLFRLSDCGISLGKLFDWKILFENIRYSFRYSVPKSGRNRPAYSFRIRNKYLF